MKKIFVGLLTLSLTVFLGASSGGPKKLGINEEIEKIRDEAYLFLDPLIDAGEAGKQEQFNQAMDAMLKGLQASEEKIAKLMRKEFDIKSGRPQNLYLPCAWPLYMYLTPPVGGIFEKFANLLTAYLEACAIKKIVYPRTDTDLIMFGAILSASDQKLFELFYNQQQAKQYDSLSMYYAFVAATQVPLAMAMQEKLEQEDFAEKMELLANFFMKTVGLPGGDTRLSYFTKAMLLTCSPFEVEGETAAIGLVQLTSLVPGFLKTNLNLFDEKTHDGKTYFDWLKSEIERLTKSIAEKKSKKDPLLVLEQNQLGLLEMFEKQMKELKQQLDPSIETLKKEAQESNIQQLANSFEALKNALQKGK